MARLYQQGYKAKKHICVYTHVASQENGVVKQPEWALPLKKLRTTRPAVAMQAHARQDAAGSFHRAARPMLLMGRALSVLPLQGLLAPNASALRFSWCSLGMVYTLAVLTSCCFMLWMSVRKIVVHSWNLEDSSVVFYALYLLVSTLFLDVATKWPLLAQQWQVVEQATAHQGTPVALGAKVKACTTIILVACTVEHILAHTRMAIMATHCADGSLSEWLAYYFHAEYPQVFDHFAYSAWAGILVAAIDLFAMYVWNYSDMFIIVISMALVDRFKLMTASLRQVHGQVKPEEFWQQMREDYNSLSWLCLSIDKTISKLVLLSFTSNVYFICLQLYNTIRPMKKVEDIVYFYYSFGFLLLRSMLVAISAAAVNDESKEPKLVLLSVPSRSFSMEVQRFLLQVTLDDVVLTGMNFFSVTRSLILTVAGTVVTYEIFLIQFHNISPDTQGVKNITFSCNLVHRNAAEQG